MERYREGRGGTEVRRTVSETGTRIQEVVGGVRVGGGNVQREGQDKPVGGGIFSQKSRGKKMRGGRVREEKRKL